MPSESRWFIRSYGRAIAANIRWIEAEAASVGGMAGRGIRATVEVRSDGAVEWSDGVMGSPLSGRAFHYSNTPCRPPPIVLPRPRSVNPKPLPGDNKKDPRADGVRRPLSSCRHARPATMRGLVRTSLRLPRAGGSRMNPPVYQSLQVFLELLAERRQSIERNLHGHFPVCPTDLDGSW